MNRATERAFRAVPKDVRQTMTVDNGSEFARHEILSRRLGMPIYFADPYCSNQRATNENTNGLLRQYYPKGTDFLTISHHNLAFVVQRLNNRPVNDSTTEPLGRSLKKPVLRFRCEFAHTLDHDSGAWSPPQRPNAATLNVELH